MIKPTRRSTTHTTNTNTLAVLDNRTLKSSCSNYNNNLHRNAKNQLSNNKQPTKRPPKRSFAWIAYDCIDMIFDFVGTVEIEPNVGKREFWNDSFMNWTRFAKDWFGRYYLDGRVRFTFKHGIVLDCKHKYSLEQVKILFGIAKRLNSPNLSFWEAQIIKQATRINERMFTKEHTYMEELKKRTEIMLKSKENQSAFKHIKSINLKKDGMELLPSLLKVFPNTENIELGNYVGYNSQEKFKANACKTLKIITSISSRKNTLTYDFIPCFPNLEEFSINNGLHLESVYLLTRLKNLRVLEISDINGNYLENVEQEICSIISKVSKLQILTLDCYLKFTSFAELAKSKSIQKLRVRSYQKWNESLIKNGFPVLKSLALSFGWKFLNFTLIPNLEELEISRDSIGREQYDLKYRKQKWQGWQHLGKLTNLRILRINDFRVTKEESGIFFEELEKLQQLKQLIFKIEREDKDYKEENMTVQKMIEIVEWISHHLPNCDSVKVLRLGYMVWFDLNVQDDFSPLVELFDKT